MKITIHYNIYMTLAILGSVLSIMSCSNPTQEELIRYINIEVPKVVSMENYAVDKYEAGKNSKDDATFHKALKDEVVPKYKKFIEALEEISKNLKEPEVIKLNETFIDASNAQYSAFTLMLAATEAQDYTLVTQANEKLDMGRKLSRQWQLDLKTLAKKHSVELTN